MQSRMTQVLAVAFALVLFTAPPARSADNLQSVLSQLDKAAADFHATTADITFDTETLQPIADSETQTGTAYYQRQGGTFEMAAHIEKDNGQPTARMYSIVNGQIAYFDQAANQVTRFSHYDKYLSYLELGFGASGKALAALWNITDLGPETVGGVQTEKLELVAKDPAVRKNFSKVTIWVDPAHAVCMRQRFDEGTTAYRIFTYSNFKFSQSLPRSDFTFKTNSHTTYSDR